MNENFTQDELKEAIADKFESKYGIEADSDSINRMVEFGGGFEDFKNVNEAVENINFKETELFDNSIENKFDLKDVSVEQAGDFLEAKQAGETETVSTDNHITTDRSFEFSKEDVVEISSNYQDSKSDLVSVQEGFEQAIENGVKMEDLEKVAGKFGHEESLDKAVENIIKEDSNEDALKNLAENSKDEKVLEALSKSEHEEVREAVGANEKTSEAVLEKLSEDKSEIVVESVAGNKAASFETLEKLGENDNSKISETAKETIENKADEQLKDLDKDKEAKTVADAIDIMKDGKYDNDSHSDKQGQHSSDRSGQKA